MTSTQPMCSQKLFVYKKFKCKYCDYRSNFPWAVQRHMKETQKHEKDREASQPPSLSNTGVNQLVSPTSIETDEKQEQTSSTQPPPPPTTTTTTTTTTKPFINTEEDIREDSTSKKFKPGHIVLSSGTSGLIENEQVLEGPFNLQLIENFKIAIFGPSRSGKTKFLSDLLENLDEISKDKPTDVIYIFSAWQQKLTDLKTNGLVTTFLEGNSDIESELKKHLNPNVKTLVIFDDQASKKEVVEFVGNLFSIHARHSNMSVIWVSQIVFDGPNLRNIRKNADYLVIFKCPQDCYDIQSLDKVMSRGKVLQKIYEHVTKEPYSYIFCDVTQESIHKIKYRSHIFEEKGLIRAYVPIMN